MWLDMAWKERVAEIRRQLETFQQQLAPLSARLSHVEAQLAHITTFGERLARIETTSKHQW
jgi:prefoldin subunit 5